jgi:eukaryotic-like serine/threonine-protein kinase
VKAPDRLADRYRLERELGQGGMATVYLAHDLKHDRQVAIKVLKPELAAVLGAERFVQEIKTTAALQHPHILPLFDSGSADGFLYYVMPYIEGETLRTKLDREHQLGVDEAVKITTEVADALDYAHRHGVIHRDIKPENILLHDGRPMVADFGIALAVSAAAGGRMTETGLSLGTPHYMSPEQATAEKEITARSDVYSLASVVYEMLAGQPPHLGGTAQQIIMRIIADEVRPVTELRRNVPAPVAAALEKALEKLPADRFESAQAFGEALGDPHFTAADAGGGTTPGLPVGARAWLRDPRSLVVSAVAVLALGGLLWSVTARTTGPPSPVTYDVALPDSARLATTEEQAFAVAATGDFLVYHAQEVALVATPFNERSPTLSPDGRWLAYASDESGINEIYVRPFPETARAKRQVSLHGGTEPLWSHSGRELFYREATGDMVAAEITTAPAFAVGSQTVLFPGSAFGLDDSHRQYDVSADDRRFLMLRERGGGERGNLVFVDNWFQELTAKVQR